jgi:hypothetical protein
MVVLVGVLLVGSPAPAACFEASLLAAAAAAACCFNLQGKKGSGIRGCCCVLPRLGSADRCDTIPLLSIHVLRGENMKQNTEPSHDLVLQCENTTKTETATKTKPTTGIERA